MECWNDPKAQRAAADWTTARREELLSQGRGLAFETVFSTIEKLEFLARAKNFGYFVRLFFIGTISPSINGARVTARVMAGGHTVPIEKIISRYRKSVGYLPQAIKFADRVYIYDNSVDGVEARLCARTTDGKLRKVYGPLPEWVSDAVEEIPRHAEFSDVRTA